MVCGGASWPPTADDNAVTDALGAALGVAQSPGRPLALEVVERLRDDGPTLAVLDNAEHLLDAVARATAQLLADVADVRVVVTSREPLSIPGEVAWRVPSLAVPPADSARGRRAGRGVCRHRPLRRAGSALTSHLRRER